MVYEWDIYIFVVNTAPANGLAFLVRITKYFSVNAQGALLLTWFNFNPSMGK